MEVTKIPPLRCPQCKSDKVKPGFNKRVGKAFVRDGKIWCYSCNQVTDSKGKAKKHTYSQFSEDQE